VTLQQGGTSPVAAKELAVAGGTAVDLKDNVLVTAAAVGTSVGGTYTGVSGLIQSGRHGGAWDGSGLVTSMPAAAPSTVLTSLGIATAAQIGRAGGTFRGISVAAADTIVMYTYAGDANLDGLISGDDYTAIDFNVATPGASGWFNGDFNYDGIISGDDYATIDFNIVAQGTPFPTAAAAAGSVAPVPEPAAPIAVTAAIATLYLRRRRR
jgi:hypothetical protein